MLDRLSRTRDGRWDIRDYKTGGWLPDQAQLDKDRQLALYEIGVRYRWPSAEAVELVWHYLAHNLELRSRRSPDALEALRQETVDLVRRIEADREFATIVGDHCGRCPYQSICPAWRHQAEVAALPPPATSQTDTVRWVDRLGELRARRADLEAEITDIEDRVIAYGDAEGLEAVFGTRYVARVRRHERISCPPKGDPQRAVLETLLRQHGVWDDVSTLDVRALAARRSDARWPAALRDTLTAMARREVDVSVTTRPLAPPNGS